MIENLRKLLARRRAPLDFEDISTVGVGDARRVETLIQKKRNGLFFANGDDIGKLY
jgi:hypothetical protein